MGGRGPRHTWRAEDHLQKPVLSFHVGSRHQLRLSGSATSTFTPWIILESTNFSLSLESTCIYIFNNSRS